MELFCTALAADCSNSAMQAAQNIHIKTYLTSAENCNECDDDPTQHLRLRSLELFCIAFAADCSNSAMQAAAVYSYIKTY